MEKEMYYTLRLETVELENGSDEQEVKVKAKKWSEAIIKAMQMDELKDLSILTIECIKTENL